MAPDTINLERDDYLVRAPTGSARIQPGSEGWYCIGQNRYNWHLCVIREYPHKPDHPPVAVKLCQIVEPMFGQGVTYWHGPSRLPDPSFRGAGICPECLDNDALSSLF